MKRNWIAALWIPLTLGACSEWDSSHHRSPQLVPKLERKGLVEVEVDRVFKGKSYLVMDITDASVLGIAHDPLMELPALEMGVYAVNADAYLDWSSVQSEEDRIVDVENVYDLKMETPLGEYLQDKRGLRLGVIARAPENLEEIVRERGHRLSTFAQANVEIYESELAEGIIEAVESTVDGIYIPVAKEDTPWIVQQAVEYSVAAGIPVFGVDGDTL
ncbi:MAG: hypothetical protein VX278_13825 [Myxococcota bacterium]|nr:hypothetical protein [Myxococcota bacterium]